MSGSSRSATDSDVPSSGTPIAFWLLPCPQDARWLQDLIRTLAERHGCPVFEPHVTLHVGTCPPGVDPEGAMDAIAQRWPALNLTAGRTGESAAYYRSLFLEIDSEEPAGARLEELRRQLVLELHGSGGGACAGLDRALAQYVLQPHLSLLYGNLAQPLRSALARQYDFQGRSILIDGIAAVRPAAGRPDLSNVADWEVFGHRHLSAPPSPGPLDRVRSTERGSPA